MAEEELNNIKEEEKVKTTRVKASNQAGTK
jgi:hypothetical protein